MMNVTREHASEALGKLVFSQRVESSILEYDNKQVSQYPLTSFEFRVTITE